MPNHDLSHHLSDERRKEGYTLNSVQTAGSGGSSRKYLRVELRHQGKHAGSVDDWVGQDGPTGKQGRETLPDPKEHPKARQLSDAMRAAFTAHASTLHNGNKKSEPVAKRDPAAPAPTPKPPKVGSLPKPPKPPKPKATQAGVSVTNVTMKGENDFAASGARFLARKYGLTNDQALAFAKHPNHAQISRSHEEWRDKNGSPPANSSLSRGKLLEMIKTQKSEPTAILDAARVDAEVERRLAEIEGAREGLRKSDIKRNEHKELGDLLASHGYDRKHADVLHAEGMGPHELKARLAVGSGKVGSLEYTHNIHKITPIAKSESDHVKEFVLGLDLGGTRRWHSACISKDDSNLGKAIKGKQADRTYSREGSRGVPGICTGCGGELQLDPAPREVDAPVHGEDHNEHKIEKAEGKTKMPKYVEGRGWTGGEKDRLYHLTDKGTGQKWVKDIGNMRGVGPEVEVRHATRAEAEEMHQKPLHPGWKVSESVEKGYDDGVSKEWVHSHLKELSQRADEHQKAGRKADADALRAKIKIIKEKHGMGPTSLSKMDPNAAHRSFKEAIDAGDHEEASEHHANLKQWLDRKGFEPAWTTKEKQAFHAYKPKVLKSELLAGARHHYARVVRFQQLGKSEDATKSAAMCALYVERLGADPAAVPDEVRNCGPVNLQKASFHLDREVRGLPAKTLPLIKADAGMPRHQDGKIDKRYSIQQSYTGHASGKPQHVVYFNGTGKAGERVGQHESREGAEALAREHANKRSKALGKALTGAPGDTAPGATMDGGALQMAEKGMPRTMPHPETGKGGGKPDTRYSIGRSYTGHPSGKPQYVVQFANERIGQHETREGAEALARQHAAKRNTDLGFTQKSEKSDVIGEVGKGGKPLDIGDGYHVHAHGFDANGNHSVWVSKGSSRARKIQSGQNLPSVHSQRGAGEKKGHLPITKKIAEEIKDYHRKYHEKPIKKAEFGLLVRPRPYRCTNCGTVTQESTNHTDDISGHCPGCSWKGASYRHEGEPPTQMVHNGGGRTPRRKEYAGDGGDIERNPHAAIKSECAPAGSPLEKLNAMIKGTSLSKATRAPRSPQEHNEDHVRELYIYADNDSDLHRQMAEPIHRNLANKMASGQYNHAMAGKAFADLADAAAKKYAGQLGGATFSVADRREVANRMADSFRDEAGLGNYDNILQRQHRERGVTLANHPATKAPDLARKVVLPSDG